MANPRIEEVEDDDVISDPEEMDLDAFDFARPQGSLHQQQQQAASADSAQSQISPDFLQQMLAAQGGAGGAGMPQMPQMPQMDNKERERLQREQQQKIKTFQCIYPIYFDASRSREEGRRVKKEDAVRNPLARGIVDALQHIGQSINVPLQVALEVSKSHPKDWANPGRVKVLVKENGKPVHAKIANSKPFVGLCK